MPLSKKILEKVDPQQPVRRPGRLKVIGGSNGDAFNTTLAKGNLASALCSTACTRNEWFFARDPLRANRRQIGIVVVALL